MSRAAKIFRALAINSEERAALERSLAEALDELPEAAPRPARPRGPGALLELPDPSSVPPPDELAKADIRRRLRRRGILGKKEHS